ncbi:helix-turn-helix domain-containing protein [Halodesulfovibrio marinisediminis]|uniref:AraC-type DNA-binding protein n=1 Tax=Halodesulfovibrio marinisediminis DSM 17456 TaxID=1121457 RepID=A0A1N6DDA9_9BACT|nr:AraC family transcriptional regulator [Halodesulfovibrio marinisediminis]SIN68653.1 AraC-type DNA-binding protein [Halodesulfovibrio marinisediminis DSM 17456]
MGTMNIVYPPSRYAGLEILSCAGGHQFRAHLHDAYVLWLNSETGEHYTVNGGSDVLQTGAVSLIEPEVPHANRSCDEISSHLRSFYCSEEFFQQQYARIYEKAYMAPLGNRVIEHVGLWQNLTVLHEYLLGMRDTLRADELVLETFSRLFEACGGHKIKPARDVGDKRVAKAIEYFHVHLDVPILLEELAAMLGCTSYHLIRLFRLQKGMTPYAYLTQLRLEKARNLIDSGVSFSDVATQVGLSDQSHLTRQFKKRYGLTPGQYKKQRMPA